LAIFTAFWGIISYRQQKTVDRKEYAAQKEIDRKIELRNRMMREYERYLTAYRANTSLVDFGRNFAVDSPERITAETEYWLAYSSLFQLASASVLLAVTEFHTLAFLHKTTLKGEAVDQEFKRLYAEMIIKMRKDAFEETELDKEDKELEELKLEELVKQRIPIDRIESLRPALRFRVPLGDGAHELEVLR
jgi:hypothetical protein